MSLASDSRRPGGERPWLRRNWLYYIMLDCLNFPQAASAPDSGKTNIPTGIHPQDSIMDLLCEPACPVAPPLTTPYVCEEQWDGGLFRTYPIRKGRVRWVPPYLRRLLDVEVPDEPYLETLYPTPKAELQPFIQTWLFFGLLAEFLSLNEIMPGVRLIDQPAAAEQIQQLHEECLVRDNEGGYYLRGSVILQNRQLFAERVAIAPDKRDRLIYLRDCLHYANRMLIAVSHLDDSLRYSICALGELFTAGLYASVARSNPRIDVPIIGFSWHQNYIKESGRMAMQMLQGGWCPSEIEKIRSQFQGLYTMHYIAQLKRANTNKEHTSCSRHLCMTFQLDVNSYRPSHATSNCHCAHISIDNLAVSSILRFSDSYPIILVEGASSNMENLNLKVEYYEPGTPYVALSHVWANGLGNPVENSLPRCQIQRVAQLIATLQNQVETEKDGVPYRIWIDTLCCPVEPESKMISLERITDVYRNASHVLVLDAALTEFHAKDTHPAELLLRIYGSSPWMRRLWTLQEGALAKSLYIQFSDAAVNSFALLTQLYMLGCQDSRYLRIWQDVMNGFNELQGFFPNDRGSITPALASQPPLINLQRALHFRTVSVPSDEALCISTLMCLDTKYVAAAADAEGRMARVWELLARSHGGLPARFIFYVDESLSIPGWRWAPKSLLGSSVKDPGMGIDERVVRFAATQDVQGIPTSLGLKVVFPGVRLIPIPRIDGMPLHPWPGAINPSEDQIIMRHEHTGQWYRIFDWYRSRKLPSWTDEERNTFDKKANGPLCREIDTGKCALIFNEGLGFDNTRACCMVQIEDIEDVNMQEESIDPAELETILRVRRTRTVIMSSLDGEEGRMMVTIQDLANQVALDQRTTDLLAIENRSSEIWKDSLSKVREAFKEVMAGAWKSQPDLAKTVKNTIGIDLEDFMWALIPKIFSHDVIMQELPGDQVWLVD